jgi:hypothetical protein
VRGLEGFGDEECNLERGLQRDGSARDPLRQSLALDHLHHENGSAFDLEDVEKGRDRGMVQSREKPRLLVESSAPLSVPGDVLGKNLEGDIATEPGVPRSPDLPHSTGAERGESLVRTEPPSRAEAHGGRVENSERFPQASPVNHG